MAFLYKIINSVNDKIYIGVTKHPKQRWIQHQNPKSSCTKLRNAMQKHGVDKFEMVILCEGSIEYIAELEGKAIISYDSIKSGYNIKAADGKHLSMSEYVKTSISESLKKHYQENVCKNLGKSVRRRSDDRPLYVLDFWFPNLRTAKSVLNLSSQATYRREGFDNGQAFKKLRQYKTGAAIERCSPVYVGGFWWPNIHVASENLKETISCLYARIGRGSVEALQVAQKQSKLKDKNPRYGIKGKDHQRSKPVIIHGVEYSSQTEAAEKSGFTRSVIQKRLYKNDPNFQFKNIGNDSNKNEV